MASRITSDVVPIAANGQIPPQSVAASGTAQSGWVDVSAGINVLTTISVGALGGGSVAASWQQATDSSGTGAKALSGFGTGTAMASNNKTQQIDNDPEVLDINNGFKFVQLTLTNTGGSGALLAADVRTASPRYA